MLQRFKDMFAGMSDRDRKILKVLGVFVLLFVFVKFVFLVQLEAFQVRGEELETAAQTVDQYRNKIVKLKPLAEKIELSRGKLVEMDTFFNRVYEDGSALGDLADRAHRSQVFIYSITPGEKAAGEYCDELPLSIAVRGKYGNIMSLVRDLESSGAVLQIRTLNINAMAVRVQLPQAGGQDQAAGQPAGGNQDLSEIFTMPPVGGEVLLNAAIELSIYTRPDSTVYLADQVLKMSGWIRGRGDRAFIFPGPVSPHSSLAPGGDRSIRGVNPEELSPGQAEASPAGAAEGS